MRNSIRKVLSVLASALLALALASAATTAAPRPAEAASAPQVTVTRAASGKLTMRKGSSYKLAAKATAGKLSYKSSKKGVVTVSKKGVLKARKAGKATITIKVKSGTKTATKRVKVTVVAKKKFKAVKKVTAKASSSKLVVGKTAKITVAFKPKKPSNKNVTFKSSAPAVLGVDASGKVTAKKAGKATVTVTSCDNSKAKAKVAFTVTQPAPANQPPAEKPTSPDQPPAEQPTPTDQPPADPSLGELYTFTSSFVEGSEDAMCVFEVRAENVPAVSLVAGDGTYAMNDSGVDGDAEGDDGIWSATADLTWLPAGESVECKATAGGLETGPLTVTAFPAWSEELQAQAEEQEQAVVDAIDAAVTPHINADTGYIESEDGYEAAYSALEQALRGLVEDGAAVSCEMTEAGGSVKLASGPRCLYTLPLEGVQASGEDVHVEFWCVDNMGVNPSSGTSVDKTLNDQEVTCRAILTQMPQNSVVWWWGHGSYTSDSGSFLLLSEKYAHAVEDMGFDWNATVTDRLGMSIRLDSGETGIEGTSDDHATACAALGAGFFDKYRPDMSGDVFIASTCCGAKDAKLAYAMRKCGCRGYFGFSDLVKPAYDKPFVTSVIHGLQSGKTLGEAVAGAKVNVGKDQRTFMNNSIIWSLFETNNCFPIIVYGENCRSGKWGTCSWLLDENGVLTIGGGTGEYTSASPWEEYSQDIKKVIVGTDNNTVVFPSCSYALFSALDNVREIEFENIDTSNVTDMRGMFEGCSSLASVDLSGFDTKNVEYLDEMFRGCSSLTSLDLSMLDTSNVIGMFAMFDHCSSLASLNLSGLDTKNVTEMRVMFNCCSSLASLDLSGLDTSNVTDMSGMFEGCSSLTSLDLSGLDTSNVTSMGWMFYDCYSLATLDLSGLDTKNVTDMSFMFFGCHSLTSLDFSRLDTKNVTDMSNMFDNCFSLTSLDISMLDTSSVTNMTDMFYLCESLSSLKTGKSWVYDSINDGAFPMFGCDMIDESRIGFAEGDVIPEGAHTYTTS